MGTSKITVILGIITFFILLNSWKGRIATGSQLIKLDSDVICIWPVLDKKNRRKKSRTEQEKKKKLENKDKKMEQRRQYGHK